MQQATDLGGEVCDGQHAGSPTAAVPCLLCCATRVAVLTDHRVMQRAPHSGSSMGITWHTMPQ
jgi:hypothetical protein